MSPQRSTRNPTRSGGVALVIVLWVLAGLTVVAVTVASSVRSNAESVKLLRERVAAERAFLSTSSRVKIIASTAQARSNYLISERGTLLLDGRSTAVLPQESVVLQDGLGLLNLNRANPNLLAGLLRQCGASETQVPRLVDSLADYIDSDTLKRLNGAEAFEYSGAGLPPPRNAPLLSREELWRVFGWADIRKAWMAQGCMNQVIVVGRAGYNRNTAQLPMLLASGLSPANAAALLDARRDGLLSTGPPTVNSDDSFNPFAGMQGMVVGRVFRVRHELALLEWAAEYDLELSPDATGGPWRVHEMRVTPATRQSATSGAELPPTDYLLPVRERDLLNAPSALPFGR